MSKGVISDDDDWKNQWLIQGGGDMELYQLRYFIEIARQQNFTRAAARLNMAQPALSLQMKNLEAELGAELLVRGRRQTMLTAAGRAFLPKAEALLAQADAARQVVADVAQLRAGRLVIASIPSVSACWLPVGVKMFGQKHPGVELQIVEESSEGVSALVESGRADFGFLQLPTKHEGVQIRPLVKEPFVLLAAKSNPLTQMATVRLKSLDREPFVFYKGRARDSALEACRRAGFEPRIVCESGELETVRALVEAGLGVAIVPALATLRMPDTLKAVPLREPKIERQIGVVWAKGAKLGAAATAFLECIVKFATR